MNRDTTNPQAAPGKPRPSQYPGNPKISMGAIITCKAEPPVMMTPGVRALPTARISIVATMVRAKNGRPTDQMVMY